MVFTAAEYEYLTSQRIGRLATVDQRGRPQNSPVTFRVDQQTGVIEIGGHNLGQSRKFGNIKHNEWVSFVVDDLASVRPWKVRGIEIRGRAEAVEGTAADGLPGHFSNEVIRIRPARVLAWGVDPQLQGMQRRSVTAGA